MTHNQMTRWIETADARYACETAMFDRFDAGETHLLHLGKVIARVPSWIAHHATGEYLTHFSGYALAYARHPLRALQH
jgi:hypothetical protein